MKKIDVFPHILPDPVLARIGQLQDTWTRNVSVETRPSLHDLDARFRIMDRYEDYVQVLTLAVPPLEVVATGQTGMDLAQLANDTLAELVVRHPDRFLGFAAAVMLEDVDASIVELERAVKHLGALGAQIFTNVNGVALDEPRFEPFFARLAELDKVLWVHPWRPPTVADYAGEQMSKYGLWIKLGWPYETALFMSRLIFSGITQRYPNLRILTHHAGGIVPHLAGRLVLQHDLPELRAIMGIDPEWDEPRVTNAYRAFYGDTVFSGAHHPLDCALDFFGAEHILFGTDMPYGAEGGEMFIRETIAAVEEASPTDQLRRQLFESNARQLLGI